jgi:hypothetical protein
MSRSSIYLASALTSALLASVSSASADCVFSPALPASIQTKCVKAVIIPGNPLRSFDISWVNPKRAEMYFADRSNKGVQVIDTDTLQWKRTLDGFVGVTLVPPASPPGVNCSVTPALCTVNNNVSGPDGVVSHGRWLYAGDGDSTLKVFDLKSPSSSPVNSISTGGTTRVDEMALTSDGKLLLAANNAEDPPFGTLFQANGNGAKDKTKIIGQVFVDSSIVPPGFGLSLEQPSWDPQTKRFYTSIPIIANNPMGCNYGQPSPPTPTPCHGGVLVTRPDDIEDAPPSLAAPHYPTLIQGAYNPSTNTGVVPLNNCGPNGSTVGPNDNILFGCTPQNNPNDVIQLVRNATTGVQTPIANITGSDEVFFNEGDNRYYTGSSRNCNTFPITAPCPTAAQQQAALGVIDALTNTLIETVPQGSGSHSVAADSKRNLIFVPQVAPKAVVGAGGDTTNVGAGICNNASNPSDPNNNKGCVAVYQHKVPGHDGDDDEDDEDDDHGHDH